jgi:hypothetical protein
MNRSETVLVVIEATDQKMLLEAANGLCERMFRSGIGRAVEVQARAVY